MTPAARRGRTLGPALAVLAILLWQASAAAAGKATSPDPGTQPTRSLTLSTGALYYATGELSFAQRLGQSWSVVAIVGVGRGRAFGDDTVNRTLLEGGGQLRYTFVGDFRDGMAIALEAMALHLSQDSEANTVSGIALGPMLVWKWIPVGGLTLEVTLGPAWVRAMIGDMGSGTMRHQDTLQPSGRVNVGWSFGGGPT